MSTVLICLYLVFTLLWSTVNSVCPYISRGSYPFPIGTCAVKSGSVSLKYVCIDENIYFPTGNLVPALQVYVSADCTEYPTSPVYLNATDYDYECVGNLSDCELVTYTYTPCDDVYQITTTYVANLCPSNGLGLNCKSGTTLESRTEVCGGGNNDEDYSNHCSDYLSECPSGVDEDTLWEIVLGDFDIQPIVNGVVIFLGICAGICIIGCLICRLSYIRTVKRIKTKSHINNSKRKQQQQQAAAPSSQHQQVASGSIAFVAVQPQPQQVIVVPQPQPVQQPMIALASAPVDEEDDPPPEYVPAPISEAPSEAVSEDGALAPGWQKLKASDGKVYYQNKKTKMIQWEKPIAKEGDSNHGVTGGGDAGGTSGDYFE